MRESNSFSFERERVGCLCERGKNELVRSEKMEEKQKKRGPLTPFTFAPLMFSLSFFFFRALKDKGKQCMWKINLKEKQKEATKAVLLSFPPL